MPYARPDGDDLVTKFQTQGGGTSNLYACIDETSASDADYIIATDIIGCTYRCTLSDVGDPQQSTGHIVRYRFSKNTEIGGTCWITVTLLQDTTTIATWTETSVTTSWATSEQTLSEAEADSITDYSALKVKIESTTFDETEYGRVSWVEFEIPTVTADLAATLPALATSGTADTGVYDGTASENLPALTGTFAGSLTHPAGTFAATLPALDTTTAGTLVVVDGIATPDFPALTGSLAASVSMSGDVDATLPAFDVTAVGELVVYDGTATPDLPNLSGDFDVSIHMSGDVAGTLPALDVTAAASVEIYDATPSFNLPELTGEFTQENLLLADIDGTLTCFTVDGAGEQIVYDGTANFVFPTLTSVFSFGAHADLTATLPSLSAVIGDSLFDRWQKDYVKPYATSYSTATCETIPYAQLSKATDHNDVDFVLVASEAFPMLASDDFRALPAYDSVISIP